MSAAIPISMALLFLLNWTPLAAAKAGGRPCFFPDGTLINDFPCFPDDDESMCCYANHTCMSNGLCRWPDNQMPGQMRYIRGSCSDKTWKSDKCPQRCANVRPSSYDPVADCLDGQYCCAIGTDSAISGGCCSQQYSNLYLFPATAGTTVTVIGASGYSPTSNTVSGVVSTQTSEAPRSSASSASTNDQGSAPNTLAIGLGAGLGGAFFFAMVAFAVWFCVARKKGNGGPGLHAASGEAYKGGVYRSGGQHGARFQQSHGARPSVYELDNHSRAVHAVEISA